MPLRIRRGLTTAEGVLFMGKGQNLCKRGKNFIFDHVIFVILLFFILFNGVFVPNFFTPSNISNIASNTAYLVLAATGMTLVMLNGGIDFSVVAVINFGSVVGAFIMNENNGLIKSYGFIIAIVVMLLIGLIIGGLNAFSVVILKMPSFIATMATNLVFSGLAVFLTKSNTITGLPQSFKAIGGKKVCGLPISLVFSVMVVILTGLLISKTSFGRKVYAVGTNHQVARISGINVKAVIAKLFLLSGLFASLSGIIIKSWMGAGRPTVADDMTMDIIAPVIIGGTSVFGGVGKISGTIIGTVLIVVMGNSLSLIGFNWYVINTIKGGILLVVALLDVKRRIAL
jgi:ribose/xylose/arabinose/galactoside ABC-type transport system permease subunit